MHGPNHVLEQVPCRFAVVAIIWHRSLESLHDFSQDDVAGQYCHNVLETGVNDRNTWLEYSVSAHMKKYVIVIGEICHQHPHKMYIEGLMSQ